MEFTEFVEKYNPKNILVIYVSSTKKYNEVITDMCKGYNINVLTIDQATNSIPQTRVMNQLLTENSEFAVYYNESDDILQIIKNKFDGGTYELTCNVKKKLTIKTFKEGN